MQPDIVGDLLRDFYGKFGVPGEGPPSGLNVSMMLGCSGIVEGELSTIRDALGDESVFGQFRNCRKLVDDLATRLTDEELLRELCGIQVPKEGFEQLSSGVFWFALASSLDSRQGGLPQTPFDEILQLPLNVKIQMTVHGSLVIRLYIALVYMREGLLHKLISESAKGGGACSAKVEEFLDTYYIQRIRNSLAHGTFSTCIVGMVFRDRGRVVIATPGFLNWLCTWLMIIQIQAIAAISKEPHRA